MAFDKTDGFVEEPVKAISGTKIIVAFAIDLNVAKPRAKVVAKILFYIQTKNMSLEIVFHLSQAINNRE